jgi:hypothetical protein
MSDRTLLVQPSMVLNSTRVVDRPPQEAPRVGSPPLAPFRESLPQRPFFLQASRLETIRCLLRARQFSEDAISCLTLAQRRGTIDAYQSKWSIYQTWCGKEGVHPVFPTLPKLVDFLNYLFTERKLSVSSKLVDFLNYMNLFTERKLSRPLRDITKVSFSDFLKTDRLLGKFLGRHVYDTSTEYVSSTPKGQGPDTCRPRIWDVSLVLRALMDRASLKNITLMTVFLVALATAQRRSELHALSYEKISFNKERVVQLAFVPGFLVKNQVPNTSRRPVIIPSVSNS